MCKQVNTHLCTFVCICVHSFLIKCNLFIYGKDNFYFPSPLIVKYECTNICIEDKEEEKIREEP